MKLNSWVMIKLKFVIVTGMSGAGKSKAMEFLEDIGYYCIDNVPPKLLSEFIRLFSSTTAVSEMVALGVDIRGGELYDDLSDAYLKLKNTGAECKLMFMDAADDVLLSRYKETRRKHPLLDKCNGMLTEAITAEREHITPVRMLADIYIDTSKTQPNELKLDINRIFLEGKGNGINIMCVSYGTKYGSFPSADLSFDVRCLPNPFYIDGLKHKTGNDNEVYSYVFGNEQAIILRDKILDLIDYLIPLYINEGKTQLVIAFGCTGGQHRSVSFARAVFNHLTDLGYDVAIKHRDAGKH